MAGDILHMIKSLLHAQFFLEKGGSGDNSILLDVGDSVDENEEKTSSVLLNTSDTLAHHFSFT